MVSMVRGAHRPPPTRRFAYLTSFLGASGNCWDWEALTRFAVCRGREGTSDRLIALAQRHVSSLCKMTQTVSEQEAHVSLRHHVSACQHGSYKARIRPDLQRGWSNTEHRCRDRHEAMRRTP